MTHLQTQMLINYEILDSADPNVYFVWLGLPIDEVSRKKMDLTAEELKEEKDLAYSCLS